MSRSAMSAAEKLTPSMPPFLRVLEGGLTDEDGATPTIRVLIVDDDEDDAYLVERQLQSAHPRYEVERAGTYELALEALTSDRCDAALIDYRLGGSTGVRLIEACRASGTRIPLILLTGQGNHAVDLDAMRRGASDYLDKNEITPSLLERSIRYALEQIASIQALVESQRRYAAAVEGSNDGIWDWNLRTGTLYLSDRFKEMLGFPGSTEVGGISAWMECVHPIDRPRLERAFADHLAHHRETLALEYRARHGDGSWRWMHLRGRVQRRPDGVVERMAGSQSDITPLKASEECARHQALHDPLTGLANRALLASRLEHAAQRRRREPEFGISILYIDLDRFKPINDRFGHAAGDRSLVEIAGRLRRALREVDCVARVGGDEFVVLLDDVGRRADALAVARKLEQEIEAPIALAGGVARVGASIGVHVASDAMLAPDQLLSAADRCMYEIKAARR